MNSKLKRLLIVDDSEIDREILKNILHGNFELVEAVNGYYALEIIESGEVSIDAILLDVQMPFIDGFEVMKSMHKKGVLDTPVFLITSEATTDNIHRAARYKFLKGFIKKPYEREYILEKLGKLFNISLKTAPHPEPEKASSHPKKHAAELSSQEIAETKRYISKLKVVFNKFLASNGISEKKYVRISGLMKLLTTEYAESSKKVNLNPEHIELIGEAAYFYNIGIMVIPPEITKAQHRNTQEEEIYRDHSNMGSSIVQMNTSVACSYFVHRCSDICMYHHELYNNGVVTEENDVFPQLAAIAIQFDALMIERPDISDSQFKRVIAALDKKYGTSISFIKKILVNCQEEIIEYYLKR